MAGFERTEDGYYIIPKEYRNHFGDKEKVRYLAEIAKELGLSYAYVKLVNDCEDIESLFSKTKKTAYNVTKCPCVYSDEYEEMNKIYETDEFNGCSISELVLPSGKEVKSATNSKSLATVYEFVCKNSAKRMENLGLPYSLRSYDYIHNSITGLWNYSTIRKIMLRINTENSNVVDAMFMGKKLTKTMSYYEFDDKLFPTRYALFKYLESNLFPVPPSWVVDYQFEKEDSDYYLVRTESSVLARYYFESETESEKVYAEHYNEEADEYDDDEFDILDDEEEAEESVQDEYYDGEFDFDDSVEEEYEDEEFYTEVGIVSKEETSVNTEETALESRKFFLLPDGTVCKSIEAMGVIAHCTKDDVLEWLNEGFNLEEAINGGYMASKDDNGYFDFPDRVSYKDLTCETFTELCEMLYLPRRVILTRVRHGKTLEEAIETPTADRDLYSMLFSEFIK